MYNLVEIPQEPLKQFLNVVYIIFPHTFLEFIRTNDIDASNLFSKLSFTPRLLTNPKDELKIESLRNFDFDTLLPELQIVTFFCT